MRAKTPDRRPRQPGQITAFQPNALRAAVHRALLVSAATSLAVPAWAQEAVDEADDPFMEEVIVTVERREQNLQDVAATVQSFSNDDLLKLGLNSDFSNLQYAVPGLQIAKQEGKLEVYLRGIGSADSDFSSDPSVAIHYNGVYLPRPRGIGPLFFDSERVEINKGPQGTLRGRNATGGTINIISRKPDFDAFSGHIQGGVGNFDGREFEAVLNIPINESIAARASVWSKFHSGLYTNAFGASGGDFRTPSEQDDLAYRVSLRWFPTEDTVVDFQYFNADVKSTGDPGAFGGRSLARGFDVDDLDDPWDQYFRTEGNFEQDVETALLQVSHEFPWFGVEYNGSVNNLTAYNSNASREFQLGFNFPGSEAEGDFIASGASPFANLLVNDTFSQADASTSYSNELRFYSNGDGRLQWTAGVFQFHEDFNYLSWDVGSGRCADSTDFVGGSSPVGPNTISCWQNGLGGENRGDDSEVDSLAFFADATFDITDTIRVKAGYRYTDEEKIQRDSNAQYQFNFNADFFLGFNQISEPTDLIIGEPGFRLTLPAERQFGDLVPGQSALEYWQDGIARYGLGDNWGDLLDACNEGVDCEVVVTSLFDPSGELGTLRADNNVRDNYTDWRLGVEFDTDGGNLLYGTLSTGTRSGGINRPLVAPDGRQFNRTWAPEELTVYEFGWKNQLIVGDFPFRLNAALFYYDYAEYVAQVLVDVPNPTLTNPDATTQQVLTDNVSNAGITGLEVEFNADFWKNINVNANLLYLDSEFQDSAIVDPRSSDNIIVNVDGNALPNVSEWNLNLRVSQFIPISKGYISSVDWTVNMLYRSEFFLSPFNNKLYYAGDDGSQIEVPIPELAGIPIDQLDPAIPLPNNNGDLASVGGESGPLFFSDVVDSFAIFNFTAGMNFGDDEEFRMDLFVENVFEQAISTKAFVNSSVNIRYLNAPRIYGLRFRARFE
ncbi:MAG: TonB-dependent receptor [Pseudomonadota bacterium]